MIDQSKQLETILRETAHFSHAEQAAREHAQLTAAAATGDA